jgi:hypothetical protein
LHNAKPANFFPLFRCIEWSASGDTLELTEISLDHKLDRNRVKFRFMDAPILSGGISIHETLHEVVVLVATVSSVHKMSFPHPERIRKQLGISSGAQSIPSIFAEANAGVAKEHCHVLQTTGTSKFRMSRLSSNVEMQWLVGWLSRWIFIAILVRSRMH